MLRFKLTSSGALVLGLYEVVYKMALPEGHGGVVKQEDELFPYSSLPTTADDILTPVHTDINVPSSSSQATTHRVHPSSLAAASFAEIPLAPRIDRQTSRTPLLKIKTSPSPSLSDLDVPPTASPLTSPLLPKQHANTHHLLPVLPPALHANFLTSCIGLATLVIFWVPIPFLHWVGWETFRWPGSQGGNLMEIWGGLEAVAWGGAIYVRPRIPCAR